MKRSEGNKDGRCPAPNISEKRHKGNEPLDGKKGLIRTLLGDRAPMRSLRVRRYVTGESSSRQYLIIEIPPTSLKSGRRSV